MPTQNITVLEPVTADSFKPTNEVSTATNGGFAFVEVDVSGRVTDKKHLHTIRKHIMKDIGKARRKRPASQPETKSKVKSSRGNSVIPNPQAGLLGSGRMDPFVCYPVPVDMEMLFLIDHVHTCSDPYLRPFKDTWFPISLSDSAFFNEILSHVAAYVFTLRNGLQNRDDCTQSIALHSRAIHSVRKRLLDPVLGISDGVIGTVLAFACFSHRTNDWAEYDMHMGALYRIIEARGGISYLSANPVLRQLLSRVDLAGTCFLERPRPLFPLPVGGGESTSWPWAIPQTPYPDQSIWKHAFPARSPIVPIFHEITTFVMILKSDLMRNVSKEEISLSINRSTIRSLVDRLEEISVPISAITEGNLIEECCRLAALLLLGNISSHFSVSGSGQLDIENHNLPTNVQKLHTILITNLHYKEWLLFKPLLNWSACLAAVSTENEEMKDDFLHLIIYAGRLMGLGSWREALITAGNMKWIGEVFDERFLSITERLSWESS
jgi:hypothetical protein